MIDRHKPVWQLTVGELTELIHNSIQAPLSTQTEQHQNNVEKYAYGLDGLARLLGCSRTRASQIKSSGLLDDAISQNGRKIIVDKEKAIELFNQKF